MGHAHPAGAECGDCQTNLNHYCKERVEGPFQSCMCQQVDNHPDDRQKRDDKLADVPVKNKPRWQARGVAPDSIDGMASNIYRTTTAARTVTAMEIVCATTLYAGTHVCFVSKLAKTITGTARRWRNCREFGGCGAVELGMGAAVHVQIGRRNTRRPGSEQSPAPLEYGLLLFVGYQAEAINSPMSSSLSTSRPRDANHVHMFRQSRCRSSVPRSFPARSTNWGRSMITSLSPAASTL